MNDMQDQGGLKPIFIFSLPRSGSTLLQRMLSAHPLISSTAEPWLLLPFFYALRKEGVYAEYMHQGVAKGVRDFVGRLPDGVRDYHGAVRRMALDLYAGAAESGAQYFIDKTPRYSLIAREIIQAFPDAKFIFLWRNPLAVAASMIESWGEGKWNLYDYYVDLYQGMKGLLEVYSTSTSDGILPMKYEDLVSDPERETRRICAHLGISYDEHMVSDLPVEIQGLGDVTGIRKYKNMISEQSCNKWRRTVCNPLRRFWFRKYCEWIGPENFKVMGYEMDSILNQLSETEASSGKYLASDLLRMMRGVLIRIFPMRLLRTSVDKLGGGAFLVKIN